MKKAKKFLVGLLCIFSACCSAFVFGACEEEVNNSSTQSSSSSTESTESESSSSSEEETPEEVCGSKGLKYSLSEDETYYVVTGIGECTDTDMIIPPEYKGKTVASIGNYAFDGCTDLTSIEISGNIKSIGVAAFCNCSNLTNIEIPNSVTLIEEEAFSGCYKLVEVYNKSSLNITAGSLDNGSVGFYAFAVYSEPYISKLTTDSNGYLIYIDNEEKILIGYTGDKKDLILPTDITEINRGAFDKCVNLTSVKIPNGVKLIDYDAFWGCANLTSVEIPDSVEDIGAFAFAHCKSLTSIEIPERVTSLEWGAFDACDNLTSIVIPNKMAYIGLAAFADCGNLTSVYYKGNAGKWEQIEIDNENAWNNNLTSATRYYYIENEGDVPTDGGNYWRYVGGVPTPWGA